MQLRQYILPPSHVSQNVVFQYFNKEAVDNDRIQNRFSNLFKRRKSPEVFCKTIHDH